jgi:hypothetical protein
MRTGAPNTLGSLIQKAARVISGMHTCAVARARKNLTMAPLNMPPLVAVRGRGRAALIVALVAIVVIAALATLAHRHTLDRHYTVAAWQKARVIGSRLDASGGWEVTEARTSLLELQP